MKLLLDWPVSATSALTARHVLDSLDEGELDRYVAERAARTAAVAAAQWHEANIETYLRFFGAHDCEAPAQCDDASPSRPQTCRRCAILALRSTIENGEPMPDGLKIELYVSLAGLTCVAHDRVRIAEQLVQLANHMFTDNDTIRTLRNAAALLTHPRS